MFIVRCSILPPQGRLGEDSVWMYGHKRNVPHVKGWFQGELLTSSPTQFDPSVTLLNWMKVCNAVCTPTPIHRLCTQTFSPPQKTNALLGIEPAAPPPSQSPSRDVNPLHQSTIPPPPKKKSSWYLLARFANARFCCKFIQNYLSLVTECCLSLRRSIALLLSRGMRLSFLVVSLLFREVDTWSTTVT